MRIRYLIVILLYFIGCSFNNPYETGSDAGSSGGTINVSQGSTDILSGSSFYFGTSNINNTLDVIFLIENNGAIDLNLSGSPLVQISGAAEFSVLTQPSGTISAGSSANFTIRFTSPNTGTFSANILISNNDPDNSSYTFTIDGFAIEITGPTDFDYTVEHEEIVDADRSMRAIALSPDGLLLYSGFVLHMTDPNNKNLYAYNISDWSTAYTYNYGGPPRYCKAVAVHSSGKVYYTFADSDEVGVFDADLTNPTFTYLDILAGFGTIGARNLDPQGIAIYGNYLYASSDELGRVYRYNIDSSGNLESHDSTWNAGTGFVTITDIGAELVQLSVNPNDGSIWCAGEDYNQVYRIVQDGTSFSTPLVIPTNGAGLNASPHDIDFIGDYVLVAFAANDGRASAPRGIGVYRMDTYAFVTTLIDGKVPYPELRNAEGMVVDVSLNTIYVVDGFYGAPNGLTQEFASTPGDFSERDLILELEYNNY